MSGGRGGVSAARRRAEEQAARLESLEDSARVGSVSPLPDGSGRAVVRVGRLRFGPLGEEALRGVAPDVRLDGPLRSALADGLRLEAARADALRLLRARARSKRDMVSRLVAKGHTREHAQAAVDRLEAARLIDDAALARDRAGRITDEGRAGPRGVEVKLRAMGIDSRLATTAASEAFEGVDLLERASALAARRAASLPASLDDLARRRRLYGFLARRGYDPETCRAAIERALGRAD